MTCNVQYFTLFILLIVAFTDIEYSGFSSTVDHNHQNYNGKILKIFELTHTLNTLNREK